MKPEEFTSFEEEKPEKNKYIIVTNNLNAKDAHGEMSHVWLTNFWKKTDNMGVITFVDDSSKVINLTHWKYA